MSDVQDDYITAAEAAETLGLSERQVNRYGSGPAPRLRTDRRGRRVFYHRADVADLAAELGVDKPRPTRPPKADLVPIGEMLAYLRERDAALAQRERELVQLAAELGAMRQQLDGQRALVDHANDQAARLQEALEAAQAERDGLRQQLDATLKRRPWWRRLIGGDTSEPS